jgi:glucokinase-like ROK family protein
VSSGRPLPDEALGAIVTILDLVRHGSASSRTEITHMTGLSKSVVVQRVNELVARGFLSESNAPSTGGRPPRHLTFRTDAGHILVADVGATSIDVAVADVGGRIIAHQGEPADVSLGPEVVIGRLEELFDDIIAEARPPGELWGLGIGVPGPVEFRTGRPISPPIMPGWDGFPVREQITERYGVPVWVDNDVNIMALGEWRAGIARGHSHVIFVKVGTGIGSGIMSNGTIHRGAQGSAGDIGHMQVVDDRSEVCRCGKVGCLEALAGGGAIARDGETLALAGESPTLTKVLGERGRVTAKDVSRAASMGDPVSVKLLERSGRLVGQTLAGLVNFFNPSLVVIGGGIANAGDSYLATIRQTIYARSAPLATRDLAVQLSRLGNEAGVTGAASMVLDQLFSAEYLSRWIERGQPAGLSVAAA